MIAPPLREAADVAVVGGGIVGCSTALELARRGLDVVLLERGDPGAEQSSRAWGFVRQQGRHPAEIPLAAEAHGLWRELSARYGAEATGFTEGGILTPAETEADEDRIAAAHRDAAAFGLRTRMLAPDALRALLPQLDGTWRSALLTEGDGYAEPARASATILRAAEEAGVRVARRCPVLGVSFAGGRVEGVRTADGLVRAERVLLAAGVGTAYLARSAGLALPVQVMRSTVGRTVAAAPFTRLAMWGPRVAYRPRPDGSFVIGNGYRGVGGDYDLTPNSFGHMRHFLPAYRRNWRLLRLALGREFAAQRRAIGSGPAAEPPVNRAKMARNLRAFHALFPHLGNPGLEATWAGRIDLTPDVIPILDRPFADKGLFIAAGSPATASRSGPPSGARWRRGWRRAPPSSTSRPSASGVSRKEARPPPGTRCEGAGRRMPDGTAPALACYPCNARRRDERLPRRPAMSLIGRIVTKILGTEDRTVVRDDRNASSSTPIGRLVTKLLRR